MSNTVLGIALCVLFDLSGSHDVTSIQSRFPVGHFRGTTLLSLTVSEIFNVKWRQTKRRMPTTVA